MFLIEILREIQVWNCSQMLYLEKIKLLKKNEFNLRSLLKVYFKEFTILDLFLTFWLLKKSVKEYFCFHLYNIFYL